MDEVSVAEAARLVMLGDEWRRSRPLEVSGGLRLVLRREHPGLPAAAWRLRLDVGIPPAAEGGRGELSLHIGGIGLDRSFSLGRAAGWISLELEIGPEQTPGDLRLSLRGQATDSVWLTDPVLLLDQPARRGNLLLVTADTLRADHLGCYGDPVTRTPFLDNLAREGVLFADVTSAINNTVPSHATIMTSLYPKDHGVLSNQAAIEDSVTTLAEILHEHGYRTAAVLGSSVLRPSITGLGQGFETVYDVDETGKRDGSLVVADALRWLEGHHDQPFFLWVHLYDSHAPYHPPSSLVDQYYSGDPEDPSHPDLPFDPDRPGFKFLKGVRDVNYPAALYRGEVADIDRHIGRLLEALDDSAITDDTLIVFTADHGESLTAHDIFFRHVGLFPDTIRVPWIMWMPGGPKGVTVDRAVETVDLAPTILDELGIPAPSHMRGVSQAPYDGSLRAREARFLQHANGLSAGVQTQRYLGVLHLQSHRRGEREQEFVAGAIELYDLRADPLMLSDISAERRQVAEGLALSIESWLDDRISHQAVESELSAEELEGLRQLGYLEDG